MFQTQPKDVAVRNNRKINRSLGNIPYLQLKKQEEVNILNLMFYYNVTVSKDDLRSQDTKKH